MIYLPHIMTDEAAQYTLTRTPLISEFTSHNYVKHGIGEYVRGDIHTNTIEGCASIFKRSMKGVFQHCSKAHMKRYLCEFDFRYNHRPSLGISDAERSIIALKDVVGKRLLYRDSSSPNI